MDARRTLPLTAAALLACNDMPATPASWTDDAAHHFIVASSASLTSHLVSPTTTDPAIKQFIDNHQVWLNPAAPSNHRLLVFMPGTGQKPSDFMLIQQEAARLGYHVIGLSIVNTGALAKLCPATPDPAGCFEQTRLEYIDGIDRTPLVEISPTNSIDNRLTKLLEYLVRQYPEEGWSQFLNNGGPSWPLIAVAGLSLGGGEAAMIAKIRLVARVLMFSAVPDSIGKTSAPWETPGATPANRYYGLAHEQDAFFAPILGGWASLGMTAFGSAMNVDSSDPPYGWSHMLTTGLTPQGGFVGQNAHGSTATDKFLALDVTGSPPLLVAWRYLLTGLPRHPGDRD
jgi:hypothetical protein